MLGIRPAELILIAGMFLVGATVVIGTIYIAVRLALRHERKNSK